MPKRPKRRDDAKRMLSALTAPDSRARAVRGLSPIYRCHNGVAVIPSIGKCARIVSNVFQSYLCRGQIYLWKRSAVRSVRSSRALTQLVQQPRILDGDDGLSGEVLPYSDLFF